MEITKTQVDDYLTKESLIAVPSEHLEKLMEQNLEMKEDAKLLYETIIKVLESVGLADNGIIKKQAFETGGSALKQLLKEVPEIIRLGLQASVPRMGEGAKKELTERFGYVSELLPIINKYSQLYGSSTELKRISN